LNTSSGGRDESLDSGCVISSGEFLLDRLDTWNNGDGEQVDVDLSVEFKDVEDLGVGLGFVEESSVAFLP
jgi:hypothetical protein